MKQKQRYFTTNAFRMAIAVLGVAVLGISHGGTFGVSSRLEAKTVDRQLDQKYLVALSAAADKYFPGSDAKAATKRIYRLTRDQLDATVASLLPDYFAAVGSIKKEMSKDPLQTNYEYAEILSFNSANISSLQRWINNIVELVEKKPAGVINCSPSRKSTKCLAGEARAFVARAFRGDVSDKKIKRITSFFLASAKAAGVAKATAELVEIVLNSPDFLFRKEVDVDKYKRLVPAQRLQAFTYIIADSPPEALKFDSTSADRYVRMDSDARGSIGTIVASSAAREKLVRFFKAWLEIKEPGEFKISQKLFPDFDTKLQTAMLAETDQFLRAQLGRAAPRLSDITQSTQSFISKRLEPIYGIAAGDPSGASPVNLDPSKRFGIFTQPALLASHSGPTDSRPIKRGVFWVRKVMCMELGAAPKGTDTNVPDVANMSRRQQIEQVTNRGACIGCHKVIDPFGFFLENFDALGRWRDDLDGFRVDASIAVDFLDEGPVRSTNPIEILRTFTNSMKFKQCFVRQMFRFYMGRQEEPSDHPFLRAMFLELAQTDNLLELIYKMVSSDRIARRE